MSNSLVAGLVDYSNPDSLGSRMRGRRFRRVADLISQILSEKAVARILDLGGRQQYWLALDADLAERCHVTLVNTEDEFGSIEASGRRFAGQFENVVADGCDLNIYQDNSFDLVHSNSVVEHVGPFERKVRFAAETRRLARRYYVQTPNLWFPMEPHYLVPFVHWLPKSYRARRLSNQNLGLKEKQATYADAMEWVEHCDLLDLTQFRYLFPDGEIHKERFGPLVKSLVAIRS
ncbi:Methyltransferase domain protein [Hartmannibacter diazotrophicus]|uniref:Methyltransferase domain protein n=1 Tax=Hartmannibacter diazotrophicus TaxID=1482074 RepID=A0A2C9D8R8_9HYPH|nr:class I SAM-dependent methyltransferase [Hartmannibacter diazotrophicus]SON56579.1 Methyltransferase domain protein [Hartmannibacter diazotrophicus]